MISSRFHDQKLRNRLRRQKIHYSTPISKAMISISATEDFTKETFLVIDVLVVSRPPFRHRIDSDRDDFAAGRVVGLNSGLRITKDTAYSGRGLMVDVSSSSKVRSENRVSI